MSQMNNYLIWAAEKLEKQYGWKFEDAMEWLTKTHYIPAQLSVNTYLKEGEKNGKK